MTGTIRPLTRDNAVQEIARAMAGRRRYLAAGFASPALGAALDQIPDWLAYLDTSTDIVMTLRAARRYGELICVAGVLMPTVAVITIPKTIPASVLRKAFRIDEIGRDKEKDIFMFGRDGGQYHWPTLLVDAIAVNEPKVAAQIYASDVRTLS